MKAEKIQKILVDHGIAQPEELSKALEAILNEFTKDSELIKNVGTGLDRELSKSLRKRGIR
jgi:hypothetical protein